MADVNAKADDTGRTALIHAANYNKNLEVMSRLVEHGADINANVSDGIFN